MFENFRDGYNFSAVNTGGPTPKHSIHLVLRAALALATYLVVAFLTGVPLMIAFGNHRAFVWLLPHALAAAAAIYVFLYATDRRRLARTALCAAIGGVILGGTGFAAGFFGPMIFAPGANQGPLLGLLITGPLGFILGAVCGFIFALVRRP